MLSFVRQGGEELEEAKRHLMVHLSEEVGDKRVIEAMDRVPREEFVPESSRFLAYEDTPLPIGEGQTVSQPLIVALMVRALELKKTDKVLEVGTGSGYQAAILAQLSGSVVSVERIESLADSARERLRAMGYKTVKVVPAEEGLGCPKESPYDAIIVAAGTPKLPWALMEQLADGGRLVAPVGSLDSQELMKVTRSGDEYSVQTLGACRFVPLIGEGAWPES